MKANQRVLTASQIATARRWLTWGLTGAGVALGLAYVAVWGTGGVPADFHAYWAANLQHLYTEARGTDAFLYPPVAAQVALLLHLLPFAVALVLWRLAQVGAVVIAGGPWAALLLLTYPVASEINLGNINLFLGLAVVLGFRWPAVWSFILLTKPTCGVGLLWYVGRRDWRSLRVAVAVTAIIAMVSFALAPGLWIEYGQFLLSHAGAGSGFPPFALRLPVAVVVALVSGRLGWRPGAVVAVWLAMPVWYWTSPAVLLTGGAAFAWHSPLTRSERP